jgi:hypothetical protein
MSLVTPTGHVSSWSTCDATATTRGPLYYGRDGLEALHGIFAACALDAACRQAFPDPPRQLDAVLRRLQREPAAVPWKHPKTGAAITVHISRATCAEILWAYLQTERRGPEAAVCDRPCRQRRLHGASRRSVQ